MKNSKKKRLLFEQGKRRYAVKKPFGLYPGLELLPAGTPTRNYKGEQIARRIKHLWDGNSHPRAKV